MWIEGYLELRAPYYIIKYTIKSKLLLAITAVWSWKTSTESRRQFSWFILLANGSKESRSLRLNEKTMTSTVNIGSLWLKLVLSISASIEPLMLHKHNLLDWPLIPQWNKTISDYTECHQKTQHHTLCILTMRIDIS